MSELTGQDVINDISNFIRNNKLQKLELQDFEDLTFSDYLDAEHHDEIEYTLDITTWETTIKHIIWDGDGDIISSSDISSEEAMNLRFPKKESLQPRRYRILVTNGNYTVPETLMVSLTDVFKEKFSDLCSEPGKRSNYKEKISFYEDTIYVLATKENFNKILEQIEYERVPSVPPIGKTYYIFKGFKEE